MNCKPWDIAVMCGKECEPENLGVFVRVLQYDASDKTWAFEDASRPIQFFDFAGRYGGKFSSTEESGGVAFIYDNELRPIRDPGEDAKDQTLEWLPVPSKEKETA